MMKKLFLIALLACFTAGPLAVSFGNTAGAAEQRGPQNVKVSGVVKDAGGEAIPGVGVVVKGTRQGTATDFDGRYELTAPMGAELEFSALGYETKTVTVTGGTLNIVLEEGSQWLDDVIVTGVAKGTSKATLPFTVEKVSDEALKEVVGTNVATALAGKMPGIKIVPTNGNPTTEPIIQLRGGTSFDNQEQPLIIVDGIVTQGGINDINMEDVESIEIIKGAAAASFYGSKAAGGVIHIIPKRGASLDNGQVHVTFKTEEGPNWVGFRPARTTAHNNAVDATGQVIPGVTDPDTIYDNKFISGHDSYDDFFVPRIYASNTLSMTGRSKSGDINYYASIQNTNTPGVVVLLNGVTRTSFRANMDAKLSKMVTFSTSNLFVRSLKDNRSINFDDIYYSDPDVDFNEPNLDGTPYKVNPNRISTRGNINPLYDVANKRAEGTSNRFLGNYSLRFIPTDWLSFNAVYSVDFSNFYDQELTPKGRLTTASPDGTERETGSVYTDSGDTFKHNLELSSLLTKKFGDFNTNLRLQYLYEDTKDEGMNAGGDRLAVSGMDIISLELADPDTYYMTSWGSRIISNSLTAVFQGDYKETYMLDALIRRDGSSLNGDDSIWNNYFRVSGAWNIAKTFDIPNVQLLKPRVSYGTTGLVPGYGQKYETFSMNSGTLYGGEQVGNKLLKPALSKELEVGLDVRAFDRVSLGLTWSSKKNTGMPYKMSVSGATGFEYQYINIGEFFTNAYEAELNVNIIKRRDMMWDATLTWDRYTQRIGELGRPNFTQGNLHIDSNSPYGEMYGTQFARSMDEVRTSPLIKEGQTAEDVFTFNNFGYIVRKDLIGTANEAHMYVLDEKGSSKQVYRGNMLPKYNMNLTNTFAWKNFLFYFTMSYQQGGLLYNNTLMYMAFAGHNAAYWDMSGRDWSQRKPASYVGQYPRNTIIEDITFLKLRELALNYTFTESQLKRVGIGVVKGIKLGIIGRNLFTLTNFNGPDPETNTVENGILGGVDTPKYPSDIRTFSGTLTIDF